MGWKTFKDTFNIEHNIQVTKKGICVGSGYAHDLVVINVETGEVKENSTFSGFLKEYYPKLAKASPAEVLAVLKLPDMFRSSISVFTYEGSTIIEEHAEEFGYPHTTHQGNLMYENTYFKTREEAVKCAQQNNKAAISLTKNLINDYQKKLSELQKEMAELKSDQTKLSKI